MQNGFQWVPGFWMSDREQIEYLPPPPAPPQENTPAQLVQGNQIFVPGNYEWQNNQYVCARATI